MERRAVISEQMDIYTIEGRVIRMRLAICDDDKKLTQQLKPIIYNYANRHKFELVIDVFHSGESLLRSKAVYDIILLDYQMGGLNGLNTARKLRDRNLNCAIIFMTDYPQFVYQAFEVNTFRFYEKPMDQFKLYSALDDYFSMFGNDYPILLRSERETIQVDTKDIVFLQAMNRDCLVHLPQDYFCCAKTMAVISRMLPEGHFFKVHRGYIVNFNYIAHYTSDEVFFKNGKKVPISRNCLTAFKDNYREYSDLGNPRREES